MNSAIPKEIQQFILKYIDSVAELEALILMRTKPDKKWSAEELSRELYVEKSVAQKLFGRLAAKDFIDNAQASPALYQYRPKSEELEQMIELMVGIYSQYLVPITNLIHSKTESRIQEFADAFRLKKE
jgi:predicted transcriptional regulator